MTHRNLHAAPVPTLADGPDSYQKGQTTMDTLVGMRLGEYEVLERIGEGGMGVVYRGVQPIIKKRVAIKVLKRDAASDQAAVQRLVFEAEAVNSIRHRGIIDIFSLGRLPDGRPYIVMEFLEGEPLDVYLASHPVPLSDVLALLGAICRPLGAAHRAGVVHRDLKPSNVFICESDGERYLKLLDFGIAKKAGGDSEVSRVHRVLGTPNYMAPEQARAEPVTPRTDVYALGVMAFEMLTGQLPFRGEQVMDVISGHLAGPVPSLVELNPSLPDALDALVRRMLAKAPGDRPQSTDEVQQELLALSSSSGAGLQQQGLRLKQSLGDLGSVPGSLTVDATLLRGALPESPAAGRQRRLVVGLAALVVVLGGAVALTFAGSGAPSEVSDGVERAGTLSPSPPEGERVGERGDLLSEAVVRDGAPGAVRDAEARDAQDAGAEAGKVTDARGPTDGGTPALARPRRPPDGGVAARTTTREVTEAQLVARIDKLKEKLTNQANGDEPDPSVMKLLGTWGLKARTRLTAPEREAMWKTLDEFERTFLR